MPCLRRLLVLLARLWLVLSQLGRLLRCLMAFRLPTFNLTVNIWRSSNVVANPPNVVTPGNLTPGKRTLAAPTTPGTATALGQNLWLWLYCLPMELLLPARTDIRYGASPGFGVYAGDCVEAPAGSGRFYVCVGVDDVGRGFLNEYRLALLLPLTDAMRSACSNPWGAPSVVFPLA